MDTMGFDRIDTTDFDHERRFVAFVKERAKLYQIGTDTGVRRLQTKLKKFNIKDKSPPKSKRKDKMVLDGSRTTEVGKQSKTKMDTEVDEPLPMPERKDKMVLDGSRTTEVGKQSKTKMDTEVDEPLPMPERKDKMVLDGSRTTEVGKQSKTKMDTEVDEPLPMPERKDKMVLDGSRTTEVEKQSKTKMNTEVDKPLPMPERKTYRIYLDGTHEGGLPFTGNRYLESEAWLSYHTKFLEKVFGSRASEMIEPSFGVTGIFVSLLTEELKQLGGMDGVKIFAEKPYRYEYF